MKIQIPLNEKTAKFSSIFSALTETTDLTLEQILRVLQCIKPIEPQTADEFQIVTVGSTMLLADARIRYLLRQDDEELKQCMQREMLRRLEAEIYKEELFTAWMEIDAMRAEIKVVKPDKGGWLDNREDAMPDTREDW